MSLFDDWQIILRDSNETIENDQRFPDGLEVRTPFDGTCIDGRGHLVHSALSGYCAPHWPWIQGRIIGQADQNTWLVFVEYNGRHYLCRRQVFDLLPTNPLDD